MPWKIVWSSTSVKQLEKLSKKDAQKIYDAVLDCAQEPFNRVTRLTNSQFFRLRVGNYRVILDMQQTKMLIFVVETGHRRKLYKK